MSTSDGAAVHRAAWPLCTSRSPAAAVPSCCHPVALLICLAAAPCILQDIVAAAARALQAAGYPTLSELAGGYRAWDLQYRPDGRRRAKGAFRDKSSGGEWVGLGALMKGQGRACEG